MNPYLTLVLDVDGVLIDSNRIKEANIKIATQPYCKTELLDKFLNYFTANNGIPRERKVARFFGKNSQTTKNILSYYSQLNRDSLLEAPLTLGVIEFLENSRNSNMKVFAISGGDQEEVRQTLKQKGLSKYLDGIYGGPATKIFHLNQLKPELPGLYIGDSVHDYEVALEYGFDFCFMHQYTQLTSWQDFFANKLQVQVIKNLSEWDYQPVK